MTAAATGVALGKYICTSFPIAFIHSKLQTTSVEKLQISWILQAEGILQNWTVLQRCFKNLSGQHLALE
jgi:hypothetical protein